MRKYFKNLCLIAVFVIFNTEFALATADLTGEWRGTTSCTCFEPGILKKYETVKSKRDVFISINPGAIGYDASLGITTIHTGESMAKPGTGEGSLLSCDNVSPGYVNSGLGYMGVFDFDLEYGSKDTMGVTYLISGATDTVLICKCTGQLERISMEPRYLINGANCDDIIWPPIINPDFIEPE